MKAKTLHSDREWKQILRLESGQVVEDELVPRYDLATFTSIYGEFSPFARQAKGKTRQAKLLDIICSDAPHGIVRNACWLYRGYRRGFDTFVKMIERENVRLFKVAPPDQTDDLYFWDEIHNGHVSELIELFGWMQTDESHAYLVKLQQEPFHPLVQAEAVVAMAFEGDKFDPEYMANLVRDHETPEPQLYHAIYCMMFNGGRYRQNEFRSAIWPHLMHPSMIIFKEAVRTLAPRRFCRKKLLEFLQAHKESESFPQGFLAFLESELASHSEEGLY